MLKQIHIVITILFLAVCTHLQAQTISGVTAQQNGNAIDVSYLFDYPEKYFSGTTLFVSGDNGKTWEGPLENVEFDNTKSESSGIETIQWQDPQKALAIGDQL
ncbi:MAG: hypothetical protein EOL95_11915, partial [Bacteroidia bacterium]|nr:hypothetical protein [Bacteroidia bacterium]